ncbi:MAG: hypothetical protein CUN56_00215 [Phototrophicales bacterium]|nr:MAG: hypothetical protein CUN56_00215 [Phototrophicales bacterium]
MALSFTNATAQVYTPAAIATGTPTATISPVIAATGTHYGNRIGNGRCTIPVAATNSSELKKGRFLRVTTQSAESGLLFVCGFYIQDVEIRFAEGTAVYDLSGPDQLAELSYRRIGYGLITNAFDILNNEPNWTFFNTTLPPVYIAGDNQTIYDALKQMEAQTGLRFAMQSYETPSTRQIIFFEDDSQVPYITLTDNAPENDPIQNPIFTLTRRDNTAAPVTRLYVFGAGIGADRVKITEAQGLVTPPAGYSVSWAASLITYDAAEAAGATIIEDEKTFGSIRPIDDTAAEKQNAAVSLFNAAINYMQEINAPDEILTIETRWHTGDVYPGMKVNVYHNSPLYGVINAGFTVQQVTYELSPQTAWRKVTLILSNVVNKIIEGSDAVAEILKKHEAQLTSSSAPATGSPTTTPINHDQLLGLLDDDHTQYLRADGGRILVGHLSVGAGYTIDGVDVSQLSDDYTTHVSRPDAHHSPGTLTVTSTNSTAGGTETHAIAASSNPGAAATILATNGAGQLTLQRLDVTQIVLTDELNGNKYQLIIKDGRLYKRPI